MLSYLKVSENLFIENLRNLEEKSISYLLSMYYNYD